MGDGTKENPFNSADVYMRIAENGHVAEGLDLSEKYFEEGIDLHELDLTGAILNRAVLNRAVLKGSGLDKCRLEGTHLRRANLKGTHLRGANLGGANLMDAHLEGANLRVAHLEGANLQGAYLEGAELWLTHLEDADLCYSHLEKADLWLANLEGVQLRGTSIDNDTNLRDAHWGNYILGDEVNHEFGFAINIYRRLKQWHTNAGMYDVAGEFFFREMTVKRKMMRWWPKPWNRAFSKFLSILCGYGERPFRVIGWAASVVFSLALIYFIIGSVWEWSAFWNSLYFSSVSFTALGYGSWLHVDNDWIRGIGAFESFVGVFSIALFLVTFIRKMTR